MKKQSFILVLLGVIALAFILTSTSCKKDEQNPPKVRTHVVEEVSGSTALAKATILEGGSHPIISQGFCYSSTNTHPNLADKCLEDESFSQSFQILIEGLRKTTKYYLRAYAINEIGTAYGRVVSFTTVDGLATVETLEANQVTFNSALASGIIHDEGDSQILTRGICYATDSLFPNFESNCLEVFGSDNPYQVLIENLVPETRYYFRAYAINEVDSAYGKTKFFETLRGIPQVESIEAEEIHKTSALVGGEVISSGYLPITRRGICYSQEKENPNFEDICLDYNGTEQVFQILLEDLSPSTSYYFRAYAENDLGYHFGKSLDFMTQHETITDIEGNVYRIHTIGNQVWMIDNLRVTKFSNGEAIPKRESNYYWTKETAIDEPAYCWYHNDESYADLYGALYNFATASDPRNVCPEGWRVMNDNDRYNLIVHIGGPQFGGDLKTTGTIEAGTGLWYDPNNRATNSTGFSAIPGGFRNVGTGWMGKAGIFWTSANFGQSSASALGLDYIDYQAKTYVFPRHNGFSIRCIKE
jgi:uncharacterized protein (TIGR02145 family)